MYQICKDPFDYLQQTAIMEYLCGLFAMRRSRRDIGKSQPLEITLPVPKKKDLCLSKCVTVDDSI